MTMAELLIGNRRKTYGLNLIGGVRRDRKEQRLQTLKLVRRCADVSELVEMLLATPRWATQLRASAF